MKIMKMKVFSVMEDSRNWYADDEPLWVTVVNCLIFGLIVLLGLMAV